MVALDTVKVLLGDMAPSDADLLVYLDLAKEEILNWTYGEETELTEVPSWLIPIQAMAVVVGVNGNGAEGEDSEAVDNVTHYYKYAEMLEYIHENAPAYVKVR